LCLVVHKSVHAVSVV